MSFCLSQPTLNRLTLKAQQLPIVNPFTSMHGRVFFISWLSFMMSFMAWYAFPPLLSKTIKADLQLSTPQVLNSNIVALCAGLLMRAISGPLCDQFGPRMVMVGILFTASIPTGLAGTINSVTGLYLIRFFVGIAGAAFVPCQVWCTAFFDKNVVGTANAFAAGWGNAGGGVTYFVMPAAFASLEHHFNLSAHVAWRITFIIPCVILIGCGLFALLLCDDLPTGKWSTRQADLQRIAGASTVVVSTPFEEAAMDTKLNNVKAMTASSNVVEADDTDKDSVSSVRRQVKVKEAEVGDKTEQQPLQLIEIVQSPTLKDVLPALFVPQTLMLAAPYFCTFGGELAINAILGAYYTKHFPKWGQVKSGQVAAIFGLLNIVTRPAGGFIADIIYKRVGTKHGTTAKKFWYGWLCFMQGAMALWVGLLDPTSPVTLVGGICAIALFMDAANGAAYSLLPHVNPQMNGVMSGTVGATGNFGGIIFSVIFRFTGPGYAKGIWIIGVFSCAIGMLICLIKPIPRHQRQAGGYMAS
ncbi:hypothetical protein ACM66B_001343 [Microbotryomycetes sp. NB124-2]